MSTQAFSPVGTPRTRTDANGLVWTTQTFKMSRKEQNAFARRVKGLPEKRPPRFRTWSAYRKAVASLGSSGAIGGSTKIPAWLLERQPLERDPRKPRTLTKRERLRMLRSRNPMHIAY